MMGTGATQRQAVCSGLKFCSCLGVGMGMGGIMTLSSVFGTQVLLLLGRWYRHGGNIIPSSVLGLKSCSCLGVDEGTGAF